MDRDKREDKMKFKLFKVIITCAALTITSNATAGLITNTTNDSFIDETTGLEWMDFGVNNIYSYNEVSALLTSSYSGWNLANESQVLDLWHNAFSGIASSSEKYTSGTTFVVYEGSGISGLSNFETVMNAMGYNTSGYSNGRFLNDAGGLSSTHYNLSRIQNSIYTNVMRDVGFTERDFLVQSNGFSTMLVREVRQEVPEPSTLAIFALGMIGLASRRFNKQS